MTIMNKIILPILAIILMVRCSNRESIISDVDLEHRQMNKAKCNSKYSDYILTIEEVSTLVYKELEKSGKGFKGKTIESIEPILIEDIIADSENTSGIIGTLLRYGIIKKSDPAFFKVILEDDGSAIVFPYKDIDASVVYMQSSKCKHSTVNLSAICDLLKLLNKEDISVDELLRVNTRLRALLEEWLDQFCKNVIDDLLAGGGRDSLKLKYGTWQTISLRETDIEFMPSTEDLNHYKLNYSMGDVPSVMLSFLGYYEDVNTLFDLKGNWQTIKSNIFDPTVQYWAYMINESFKDIGFQYNIETMHLFLQKECQGFYPNADMMPLEYEYDEYNQPQSILTYKKPITILIRNRTPYLLYKEKILARDVYLNGEKVFVEYEFVLFYFNDNLCVEKKTKDIKEIKDIFYIKY